MAAPDDSAHSAPCFPTPQALAAALRARLPGFGPIGWTHETGSTNADVMRAARAQGIPGAAPFLEGAHLQTAGRGRAGRVWENRVGDALMFSCAFTTNVPLATLPGLSPAFGVAACEALRALLVQQAPARAARLRLKWPNDLQWDGAKLAGILVETALHAGSGSVTIVVGMGLNLRGAQQLSRDLDRQIADWESVSAAPVSLATPADIVAVVAAAWSCAVQDYAQSGYSVFRPRFDRLDALAGVAVEITEQGRTMQGGIASGTDQEGRLILATPHGRYPVLVGDVSVRPGTGISANARRS